METFLSKLQSWHCVKEFESTVVTSPLQVLFLYEPYDELVLMQQFDRKNLRSIEGEAVDDAANTNTVDESDPDSISQEQADQLTAWLEASLGTRVKKATVTNRLTSHPCVVR